MCTCSKYCRVHGDRPYGTIEWNYQNAGIDSAQILYSYHPKTNDIAKRVICKIMNDKAVKKLCKEYSLMVDKLCEMEIKGQSKCLGKNKNGSKIYIVLRNEKGKFLSYTDIIAILLHELVHHTYKKHDSNFIERERLYRDKYVKYARNTGTIPPWIKIKFPISTGKYTMMDKTNFNQIESDKLNENSIDNILEQKMNRNRTIYITTIIILVIIIIVLIVLIVLIVKV